MPKRVPCALLLALAVLVTVPAVAGPAADALGTCLSDNTSGKDRKELSRWMFIAMSAHPEMSDISSATPAAKLRSDETMGRLVTKLIAEDCAPQAREAVLREGSSAMQAAFSALGRLAMQELMSNPAVMAAISGFEAHADRAKIQSALAGK